MKTVNSGWDRLSWRLHTARWERGWPSSKQNREWSAEAPCGVSETGSDDFCAVSSDALRPRPPKRLKVPAAAPRLKAWRVGGATAPQIWTPPLTGPTIRMRRRMREGMDCPEPLLLKRLLRVPRGAKTPRALLEHGSFLRTGDALARPTEKPGPPNRCKAVSFRSKTSAFMRWSDPARPTISRSSSFTGLVSTTATGRSGSLIGSRRHGGSWPSTDPGSEDLSDQRWAGRCPRRKRV